MVSFVLLCILLFLSPRLPTRAVLRPRKLDPGERAPGSTRAEQGHARIL